jgi:hypothetical protein
MENNQDLYSAIQNPLDNTDTIKKLIKAYSKKNDGFGGYYGQLTKTVEKKYHRGECYKEDADYFYAMMFNKWKNSILNMSREDFEQLKQQGSFENDLIVLRNYLKTIPDVTTMQEANKIFYGQYNNQTLKDAMEKYRWTSFGENSGWVHVASRYVTAKSDKIPKVQHRLYLDTESVDTYKMISQFVEKCDEHKLPYYFKFDKCGNRDDTIVIYSDTENLLQYVQLLNEIKQQNPNLVSRANEPPVLTGKIDNWIGYGSEPPKKADGHSQSFNSLRSGIIEKAIDDETKDWIMSHRSMKVKHDGKTMSFQDYITSKTIDNFIKKLERNVNHTFFANETLDDVAKKNGYSLADLKNPQFKNSIIGIVNNRIGNMLSELCNGTQPNKINSIDMSVRDGKTISFDGYDLEETLEQLAIEIAEYDKSFTENIRTRIMREGQNIGIDPDKFCFDIRTRDKMFDYDKVRKEQVTNANKSTKEQNSNNSQEETGIKGEKKTIHGKKIGKKSIEMKTVDIVDILNPNLMQRKVKLTNNVEISATQYIQEVVAPYIPRSGKFILKNGTEMPVKQYIEKFVLGEGQTKYNGDISALIEATTKANNGSIIISSDEGLGQGLKQEMGSFVQEYEEVIPSRTPIISGKKVQSGIKGFGTTNSKAEIEKKEMSERLELKRLQLNQKLGKRLSEKEVQRLNMLSNLYPKEDKKCNCEKIDRKI